MGGDGAGPLFIFPTPSYRLTDAFAYGALVLLSRNNSTEMSTTGIVTLLHVQGNRSLKRVTRSAQCHSSGSKWQS